MDFKQIFNRAVEVREKYQQYEVKNIGRSWTNQEIMEGFVGDVGDLMKLIMAKEKARTIEDVDEKLKHELCDCLWSVLVLAKKYDIDIEKEFTEKMNELMERIGS
jgi:NTP pyrophosphatase (non-canonical NTP hydrolase)